MSNVHLICNLMHMIVKTYVKRPALIKFNVNIIILMENNSKKANDPKRQYLAISMPYHRIDKRHKLNFTLERNRNVGFPVIRITARTIYTHCVYSKHLPVYRIYNI